MGDKVDKVVLDGNVYRAEASMNTTLKVLKGLDYLLSSEDLHDTKQGIPEDDIAFLQSYCNDMFKATETALKLIRAYNELEAEAKKQKEAKKAKKKPVEPELDIDLDGLLD